MPVFGKSNAEILDDELKGLAGTQISNTAQGSVVRSLLEIVAKAVGDAYIAFTTAAKNYKLSTAAGLFVDHLGELVGIARRTGETDQGLKYRINNSVLLHAKANKTSIVAAIEALEDVSQAIIRTGTMGPGSFSVIVVGRTADEMPRSTLTAVENAIKDVVAYGVAFEVLPVEYIDVDVSLEVILQQSVNINISQVSIENAVKSYILRLPPGSTLSMDVIEAVAIRAAGFENVTMVNILSVNVNGMRIASNYVADYNQAYTLNRFADQKAIEVTIRQ